jgi:two-component system NarL family response regulator
LRKRICFASARKPLRTPSSIPAPLASAYDGDEDIHRALEAGALAYLLKTALREELLAAIRAVHEGQHYLPPDVAARLASRWPRPELSPREREVLALIVKGRSNKEIGSDLGISEVTVKLHVSSVLAKMRVADRTQAATTALRRGLVHLE